MNQDHLAPCPRRALPALLLTVLLTAWLAAGPAPARAGEEAASGLDRLEEGRVLYEGARFDEAQEALRQALGRVDLSPRQRAQTWFYLGLAYLGLGHETMTTEAFVSCQAADPAFRPPEEDLSPRARELWALSGGQPAVAAAPPAAPAPAPAPPPPLREAPLADTGPAFSETPLAERGPRLSGLQPAMGVREGKPVGATTIFSPEVPVIYLWFAMRNVAVGSRIKAVWSYLNPEPMIIVTTVMEVTRPGGWGQFSCQLGTGMDWPTGDYMVELFLDGLPAGRAGFEIR